MGAMEKKTAEGDQSAESVQCEKGEPRRASLRK